MDFSVGNQQEKRRICGCFLHSLGKGMGETTFEALKEKALSLPLKPGVYLMMDREGTVIYVGKAKALKNRVSQYFHDQAGHTEKTQGHGRRRLTTLTPLASRLRV